MDRNFAPQLPLKDDPQVVLAVRQLMREVMFTTSLKNKTLGIIKGLHFFSPCFIRSILSLGQWLHDAYGNSDILH